MPNSCIYIKMTFLCKNLGIPDYYYKTKQKDMNQQINKVLSLFTIILLAGCSKEVFSPDAGLIGSDSAYASYSAIVSVKRSPTDTLYFQVDDSTRLFPRNFADGKLVGERIVCDITVYKKVVHNYGYMTDVHYYDSIDKGVFTSDLSVSGDDGLDIIFDWMTGVEDGYLTLHYSTWWGNAGKQHRFYLISGTNPADPYELILMQNAVGDKHVEKGEALVYFDINSLPDTGGGYKILTLKWTDSAGKKESHKFKFKSRE